MIEFHWRLPSLGRFNDWEQIARLEDRVSASVLTTGVLTVTVDDGASFSGYYSYDDASAAWADWTANLSAREDALGTTADQHIADCQASLSAPDIDTVIHVTDVVYGSPLPGAHNLLTSGETMAEACYALASSAGNAVFNAKDAAGNALNFGTVNPYTSSKVGTATTNAEALARAKVLVSDNIDAAFRVKRIGEIIEQARNSWGGGFLETLCVVSYQNELHGLEVRVKDNISELNWLKSHFGDVIK